MRQILISDIHGCAITFRELVKNQIQLKPSDTLYLLGDYIDRGPNSKGVIDFIFELQAAGYTVRCLAGNHEDMMLAARSNAKRFSYWYDAGGEQTAESFGVRVELNRIHEQYWNFLEKLEDYIETDEALLVHAGFNFKGGKPFADRTTMLWGRGWQRHLDRNLLGDKIIVHGHTPTPQLDIVKNLEYLNFSSILNIDSGCYVYGHLCAFDLNSRKLFFQENLDFDPSARKEY